MAKIGRIVATLQTPVVQVLRIRALAAVTGLGNRIVDPMRKRVAGLKGEAVREALLKTRLQRMIGGRSLGVIHQQARDIGHHAVVWPALLHAARSRSGNVFVVDPAKFPAEGTNVSQRESEVLSERALHV